MHWLCGGGGGGGVSFLRLLIGQSPSYLVPDWLGCVRPFVVLHCGCVPPNVSVRSFGDIVGASPSILCVHPFIW